MFIAETNSTNDLLRQAAADWEHADAVLRAEPLPYLRTDYQTAGRGQAGNSWHSRRGQNVLLSVLLRRPPVSATDSFRLSMWVSLGVAGVLKELCPDPAALTVKWPNDIYAGDRKIAGLLIENTLDGSRIDSSIIGIGLNLNQTDWPDELPNPVSLKQLSGQTYSPEDIAQRIVASLHDSLPLLTAPDELRQRYTATLYRRNGWWPYVEREVSLSPTVIVRACEPKTDTAFEAIFSGIGDRGELVLTNRNGQKRMYHFKQIQYLI